MPRESQPSGMIVHPKLPVPQQPQRPSTPRPGGSRRNVAAISLAAVLALAAGGAAGYVLAPSHRAALETASTQLASAQTAARVESDRADGVQKQLAVLTKDKQALEAQLATVSTKLAENAKLAEQANAAAQQTLQAAVDKSAGEVSTEGDEIRLKLVDKVLFAPGDDQLTDKGKAVLAKVGKALLDLPDKQVWVQGHTDDTPIGAAAASKPKKSAKKSAKPVEPAAPPRFASNWELSAARALQVVHYLQDVAKVEPTRLAALAFGEYRPVSKTNKALNRRIEIVLYPHKAVIERDRPAAKKK